MTVSVMMTTYNRLDLTKRMLDSFFQTTTSPYRLIITDNGSVDETPEYLKALKDPSPHCLSIDIHLNEENKGIARGRNRGLHIADRYNDPFLCTIDNDVILPDGWLNDILDILSRNFLFSIGINFEDVSYPLITLNSKTFQLKRQGNLGTACMVFPRDLHDKIGFFYTDWPVPHYAHEDADFGARARMVGYQLGYLQINGTHIGVGKEDAGEYREMKNAASAANLATFQKNCVLYHKKQKPIYIPLNENDI